MLRPILRPIQALSFARTFMLHAGILGRKNSRDEVYPDLTSTSTTWSWGGIDYRLSIHLNKDEQSPQEFRPQVLVSLGNVTRSHLSLFTVDKAEDHLAQLQRLVDLARHIEQQLSDFTIANPVERQPRVSDSAVGE